jgi:mutator protein MutT
VAIAVAVVQRRGVTNRGVEFLIGLRPEGAPLAGYWEFPGGKVQTGEAAEAAAVRECQEETGLAVHVLSEYPAVAHSYAHGHLLLRFFACEVVGDSALEPDSRFRWVPRRELADYQFPPANRALLAALQAASC